MNMNDKINVIWETPSSDSSGSMPLGNGDIGLNVWVEKDGDLLFYIGKTDSWDESGRLLKIGRVRVALNPNPFRGGLPFRQELNTSDGTILISAGEGPALVKMRLWVDANHPVIRIEIDAENPIKATACLELWRIAERQREAKEAHSAIGLRSSQELECVYPDTVVESAGDAVIWCHRNRTSCWAGTLEHQDMASYIPKGKDPLHNRTFGALVRGDGLVRENNKLLRTASPLRRIDLSIHVLTAQTSTIEDWVAAMDSQVADSDAVALDAAFEKHAAWWRLFNQRSWIRISGTPEAEVVSRGYELQRFINACGGRGAFPIKFNGSIFTVDANEPKEQYDADYRRWGGGYWFQNTRLLYWSMIMSGDFDLMEPWFKMYLDALPFAMARTKAYFGLENAAMFPETITFWGAFLNSNYGFNRGDLEPGISENKYIRRYWQGTLELLAVLLDTYEITKDDTLLRNKLLVLAPPFLRFFSGYYTKRDEEGKILFSPSQSLETWWKAVNPLPEIAGLQWVLKGLLALPENKVSCELRNEWMKLSGLIPPMPTRSFNWSRQKKLIPALQYDDCQNGENPELYGVFPYRHYGVGKPDLAVGVETYGQRQYRGMGSWRQDGIHAAMLGLTDEAKRNIVYNFSTSHTGSRFPAFWGPNADWIPDQDHGSCAVIALQRMLMQCDDGKIHLLPAWPKEWDVEFKLHAPGNTVVECVFRNGKVEHLKVTPDTRMKIVDCSFIV
jgi:hypothetical protein